ncbi:MAG: riboflavin synthase subunit alpha [Odoribacter sp.]|nr:riboflavin synthase subunit alpha [Odoribacter sp.]
MSGLFIIPISGLKDGHHLFDFEIGDKFFEEFEESEIKEGNLSVRIELDKRSSHFDLIVKITGEVRICCDRCLEMFFHPIASENRLLVKFGGKWDANDPDIITMPADEHELDIKQYLYEFIHLALPIQRIHPGDKTGTNSCNPEMLKKLNQHIVNDEKKIDPRWDELKKLINNN